MMATLPMQVNNLGDLLAAIDALPDKITRATADSTEVGVAKHMVSLFLAYPGVSRDGRDYIQAAIAAGASAILFESGDGKFEWDVRSLIPGIAVVGLKQYASAIGAHVYRHPSTSMWMVGVTGTNGKTSVAQWCAHAFADAGRVAAVMGTIGNGLVSKPTAQKIQPLSQSVNTTADAVVIQQTLREFADSGATTCAMEVSSHGLDQGRVSDVKFDITVFTNLTRDHLDYHKSMDAYGEAKAQLFNQRGLKTAVVNVDDVFGREVANRTERRGVELIRYAVNGGAKFANLTAHNIAVSSAGLSFSVRWSGSSQVDEALVETEILGAFNASNLVAVIGVLMASGYSLVNAAALVSNLKPVRGRMETVRAEADSVNKPLVVVDYAHTPDALEKVLSTISAVVPDKGRLISVFGCGGDRDVGKRALMGAVSAKYADLTIVTSDNPRTEDAARIIENITEGVANAPHRILADRRAAIITALTVATVDDIVVIAGKGHEDYQLIGHTKFHFSDVEIATEALASWSAVKERA